MEVLRDNEEQVLCPYNAAHYIQKGRMGTHLKKCRKSYKGSQVFAICDFNSHHRVPEPELQYHHLNCPDRKVVELDVFAEEHSDSFAPKPLTNHNAAAAVPVDSSWDDVNVPSYNPQAYCENNPIIRRLDTESAAVRKNFRTAERHRFNKFEENSASGSQSQNTGSTNNIRARNQQEITLPPTPSFAADSIEPTPEIIKKMLADLSLPSMKANVSKTD